MKPRAWWHPWVMLGPALSLLILFFLAPIAVAAFASFFSWDLLTPPSFVGVTNYRALASSGDALRITLTTLRFSAVVVVCSMSLGLGLALALNRPGRFFAFVRAAIFSAYVVSWVAVALLWMWILDPDVGLGATVARTLGLGRIAFLGDPNIALTTLAMVTVWKITGYAMIVFLVGLGDVPQPLMEAAALDGANAIARFRHVVWPLLRPTAAFVGTTSLIVSFQAFDVVRVMTQGGPVKATTLFVYAIYEQVFLDLRVGRASALTVMFFVILLMLAALQLWAFRAKGATA